MKCSLGISIILEDISSLFHSIVFLYFFTLITEESFLISPCYSLKLFIQMGISCIFSFSFCSQLFVRPPQTTILPFCISFPWGWSWSLPPVQCQELLSIVLQSIYLSIKQSCLSDLSIPSICLSLPLYNRKGFEFRSYLNHLVVFPTFFNLNLNLAIKNSWSEPQSVLVFADCIELLHLWLQRI